MSGNVTAIDLSYRRGERANKSSRAHTTMRVGVKQISSKWFRAVSQRVKPPPHATQTTFDNANHGACRSQRKSQKTQGSSETSQKEV